ncbi:hypothetical protein N5079_21050 [Planotetraspora sp. A-T 1434]|uniref:hypothetical protein n=1 Tax=Planotetraspora sp. A-T 1434 TaxID=2979219 RepID=UPI0021C097FC|nr:hypothetical protein [Planotetraspora sp. A-T 1434]MCT9932694.1 hypothetical protein [Planotetraspora sp. A-T 1434]
MVRVPGEPGLWVALAASPVLPALFLPGKYVWPVGPLVALAAMFAAVTRAYQDVALIRATQERAEAPEPPGPSGSPPPGSSASP